MVLGFTAGVVNAITEHLQANTRHIDKLYRQIEKTFGLYTLLSMLIEGISERG